MKKVIALQPGDIRILTTTETAAKNRWWITHEVEVNLVKEFPQPAPDPNCEPKVGNIVSGSGGHQYIISLVNPVHKCYQCHLAGPIHLAKTV